MKIALTRRQKLYVAIPAACIFIAAYALINPAETWWMPKCLIHFVTGLDCPGCGSQRALHSLLNGDFKAAFNYNPYVVTLLPLILACGIAEVFPKKFAGFKKFLAHPVIIGFFITITVLWTIWRNLH